MKMVQEKKLTVEDYNYPIVQFYRHSYADSMKGAETKGRMAVEYGVAQDRIHPRRCEIRTRKGDLL